VALRPDDHAGSRTCWLRYQSGQRHLQSFGKAGRRRSRIDRQADPRAGADGSEGTRQRSEDTGKIGGVGKPGQGLAIDYQVITEIRAFEISTEGADTANVEIFAKILNDRNGTVLAQKAFRATAAVRGTGNTAFIKAMDQAFANVSAEIVSWTLGSI
jgi:hypothetical protein